MPSIESLLLRFRYSVAKLETRPEASENGPSVETESSPFQAATTDTLCSRSRRLDQMGSAQPVRRVAVIGAGASGLATAKYLLAEKYFDSIDVFEQRSNVGGIWNLSSTKNTVQIPIPQTNPSYGNRLSKDAAEQMKPSGHNSPSKLSLELESPLYDYLETNIPKQLMTYREKSLPDESSLFVGHEETLQYLEEYAKSIEHLISYNTQVENVKELETSTDLGKQWLVSTVNLQTGERRKSTYDAVAVANGHYTIPFVPEYPGLREWHDVHANAIIHSKAYRLPEDYTGKKVLIIGNSVSGLDIMSQILPYASKVLVSSRSASIMGAIPPHPKRLDVPAVSRFLPPSAEATRAAVQFTNSHTETDIDRVIFATGYFYNFPFLRSLRPQVTTHGFRTEHTYQHLFYTPNPTLAFLVLNLKVIPFPLAENQAGVLSRVWSGRLSLPARSEMEAWESDTVAEMGDHKDFHTLRYPKDARMVNELYAWAESARRRDSLENEGVGKLGTFWDDGAVWLRARFLQIKAAYGELGEKRKNVRTAEELGFRP